MSKSWRISRRTLLRGVGAALCLPTLDIMEAAAAAHRSRQRVRVGYLYFPNGAADGSWQPARTGEKGELLALNEWMEPLEAFKQDIIITRNLWTPRGNGHGAGTATWLTGHGYDGRRIDAGGISVDQLAARRIGEQTLLPSLELSTRGEGYFSNDLPRNTISWTASNTPACREVVPRTIYDRMFRSSKHGTDKSVLDLVREDARSLARRASTADRRKIDEYIDSVRSIERRLAFADRQTAEAQRAGALTDSLRRPEPGIPSDHEEYVRIMLDLMVLAFWSNATRVCSFMLDHGQSNRYFNFIDGVTGTWHALSHWKDISGKTEDDDGKTSWSSRNSKHDMYASVTRWHHRQVAYLLGRLKQIDDGDGTLLDNCMILYGSNLADGHEHEAKDLPVLLAGRGGNTIKSGRLIRYEKDTSVSNLHLSTLHRLGIAIDQFGDSTGPMTELDG